MAARLGAARVRQTLLGPTLSEETVLAVVLERAGLDRLGAPIVPAEATSAVAMLLLAERGIVTVNALGLGKIGTFKHLGQGIRLVKAWRFGMLELHALSQLFSFLTQTRFFFDWVFATNLNMR